MRKHRWHDALYKCFDTFLESLNWPFPFLKTKGLILITQQQDCGSVHRSGETRLSLSNWKGSTWRQISVRHWAVVRHPHLATVLQSEQNAVFLSAQLSPSALLLLHHFRGAVTKCRLFLSIIILHFVRHLMPFFLSFNFYRNLSTYMSASTAWADGSSFWLGSFRAICSVRGVHLSWCSRSGNDLLLHLYHFSFS